MKEPKYDVYRLEVYGLPMFGCTGIVICHKLVDHVTTDLEELRRNVYEAFMHCCGALWITYLGARKLVTTCAQFEAEYGH
ncbi:hypothetical protein [Paraburkholderia acidisoli]|uniref:Uncharacterized protein n=1 Tax=Paraburkholderia acidisoli TaxID=2571748 RepID=A0A7Z2GRI3_9BURK|nr:hypothetical protein [Paraburkholderia acidisoli]QGZ66244.1 hypothetical protein FAZ98_31060 [Paraburkholderia acidisoli]QGZ66334.1 hypothetical protein FAZ98_31565 [Paraburkholderia acidisoli]